MHWASSNVLPTVNISGGSISGEIGKANHAGGKNDVITAVADNDARSDINISGGTFSEAVPGDFCADNFVPVQNGQGSYGVALEGAKVTITLSYAANGDNAGNLPAAESREVSAGSAASFTVSSTVPSRPGYNFKGWSTTAGGTTVECSAGQNLSTDYSMTLYAVWEAKPSVTLTLHYDANGGRRAPADQTVETNSGSGIIVITAAKPYRFGYFFQGWSTSPTGRVQYKPGDDITISQDTTLYAVWARPTDSPRTGDTSNLGLWLALGGISLVAVGAAAFIVIKKGRKK